MKQLAIDFASPRPTGEATRTTRASPRSSRPPEVYTRAEVLGILDGPLGRDASVRCRNRALLVVMWRAGLRIGEALGMLACDLRPDDGGVWVREGKGGKSRLAAMDVDAFAALGSWLRLREEMGLGADRNGRLFCTFAGGPIDQSYVRHMCRRLRQKAGLAKRVHPHAFRHTHATELWREGVAEKLIQLQLGHASLEATDKYLQTIGANDEVCTAIRARPGWRPEP